MNRYGMFVAQLFASMLVLSMFAGTVSGADEMNFRDLVRKYKKDGEGKEIAKLVGFAEPVKNVIAVDYKVLLVKDGKETPVDPKTHEFKMGDKIRVVIEPLNDYFVYIFQIGASGKSSFLVPEKDEDPPLVKAGKPVTQPDDGFFEFEEPAGEETLVVVATEKPVADRELLAKVLAKEPSKNDTAEEQEMRKTLKATVKKAMKSAQEKKQETLDNTVTWRGLTTDKKAREELVADVKNRKVSEGTFEEPTIEKTGSTAAIYASEKKDELARLLVSIPLKSGNPKPEKAKSDKK
jgi:hypothetical protein